VFFLTKQPYIMLQVSETMRAVSLTKIDPHISLTKIDPHISLTKIDPHLSLAKIDPSIFSQSVSFMYT